MVVQNGMVVSAKNRQAWSHASFRLLLHHELDEFVI